MWMATVDQRLKALENLIQGHEALLRRLDGVESTCQEQLSQVEAVATRHGVLYEEHQALCDCICTTGLLEREKLQDQVASRLRRSGAKLPSSGEAVAGAGAGGVTEATLPVELPRGRGDAPGAVGSRRPPPPWRASSPVAPQPPAEDGLWTAAMAALAPQALPPAGVYVCGGHASGVTLAGLDRFDPVTGRWEVLPPMPTPRHGCMAAAVIGILYVFGGANDSGLPLGTAERFDPLVGEWEQLPPMPTSRHGCAGAAAAGLLYAMGGYDGEGVLAAAERFDPAANRWEMLPPMPTPRGRSAAASAGGLIYTAGGCDDAGQELTTTECFDPHGARWMELPRLPTARSGCAATVANGALYVVGGRSGGVKLASVERMDLALGYWEHVAPMPTPRDGCAVASLAGVLHVFGGRGVGQTLSSVERYDPHTGKWEALRPMPKARCGCAAAPIGR